MALADVPPPLQASIVVGVHTSTAHQGATDRPTVAVAFNRPVVDFAATSSVSVAGGSVEEIAALVESGTPAHVYVFTLIPHSNTDIGFSLAAGLGCDTDPGGVCTADGTTLSVVPAAPHTIEHMATNSQPEFGADETGVRSVAENTPARTPIGAAVTADDADDDPLTYSLSGTDAGSFTTDNDGQIRVGDTTTLDHETKDTYQFTLSVSDSKDINSIADTAIDDTIDVT